MKFKQTTRYPNGYQPKIEYYQAKLRIAMEEGLIEEIKLYSFKLTYFLEREEARESRLAQLID